MQGLLGSEISIPLPSPQSRYKHRYDNLGPLKCTHVKVVTEFTWFVSLSARTVLSRIVFSHITPRTRVQIVRTEIWSPQGEARTTTSEH